MCYRIRVTLALTALTLGLVGCSSTYYLVKDPQSGTEYYTTEVKRSGDKVSFKDARSMSQVSLSNSEVMEITADQFRAKTGAQH